MITRYISPGTNQLEYVEYQHIVRTHSSVGKWINGSWCDAHQIIRDWLRANIMDIDIDGEMACGWILTNQQNRTYDGDVKFPTVQTFYEHRFARPEDALIFKLSWDAINDF